jgi:hypothetical protein
MHQNWLCVALRIGGWYSCELLVGSIGARSRGSTDSARDVALRCSSWDACRQDPTGEQAVRVKDDAMIVVSSTDNVKCAIWSTTEAEMQRMTICSWRTTRLQRSTRAAWYSQ